MELCTHSTNYCMNAAGCGLQAECDVSNDEWVQFSTHLACYVWGSKGNLCLDQCFRHLMVFAYRCYKHGLSDKLNSERKYHKEIIDMNDHTNLNILNNCMTSYLVLLLYRLTIQGTVTVTLITNNTCMLKRQEVCKVWLFFCRGRGETSLRYIVSGIGCTSVEVRLP